jgi:two-component system, NarL family, sensor kinase
MNWPQSYKFEHSGHLADPPGDQSVAVAYKQCAFKRRSPCGDKVQERSRRNMERPLHVMKDRRGLQILEGFKSSSGQLQRQRGMSAHGMQTDGEASVTCLVREEIENSLVSGLQASEQRLSALLHDRSRIGRELHDSVLQALYAIKLTLEQTSGLHQGAPQGRPRTHNQAEDQLDTVIEDIQCMIASVESDPEDPFRLDSELRALAQAIEDVSEVRIRVEIDPKAEEILTSEEASELIAIAKETLSDCVRRAHATQVVIALRYLGTRVQLSIRDNGPGFDVELGRDTGPGFSRMEERIRKIGGRLNVQSTVGGGTCLTADVYLEPILAIV